MKDGETLITNGTTFSLTQLQTLVDRITSTYKNTLTIEARFADIIGEYSCKVGNSIGTSNMQETEIKGRVHMHSIPYAACHGWGFFGNRTAEQQHY